MRKNKNLTYLEAIMVGPDKETKMKSQIKKQKKLIKTLKNMIKNYAPYMKFPDD